LEMNVNHYTPMAGSSFTTTSLPFNEKINS